MYNYSLKLSYKQSDNDDTYRKELLKAMNLEKYDSKNIQNIIKSEIISVIEPHFHEVFELLKKYNEFPFALDNEACVILLVSWEYFDLLHLCLGEIKENKVENSITNLITELESRK
jgi:hypothetical protein